MPVESIWSPYRFVRDWQYVWCEYFAHLQASLVGRVDFPVRKAGAWDYIKKLPQKFIGKLANRNQPSVHIPTGDPAGDPRVFDEHQKAVWEFLHDDWNEVYRAENYKGTVLGMIAEEMIRQGYDLNDLKNMNLPDLNTAMQEQGYNGLDDLDDWLETSGWKKSQFYASLWADTEGAKWLAVYDENGERAGRAYDVVTGMYKKAVQAAIENDMPIDKVRQALLYADDSLIKAQFLQSDGTLDEEGYQEFITDHLNRDFVRFAVTETAICYNNGKLLQTIHEGGEYVIFSP